MRGAVIDLSVKKCLATHRKKAVSVFRLRSASSLRRRLGVSSLLAAVVFVPIAVGLTQGVASAAPTTPVAPFTECPAVGYNTSCSLLIDATGAGTSVLSDPNATTAADPTPGTYDGDDDTLIGVINNTSAPISSIPLSSTTEPIMAFDGDGICENPNDTSGLPGLPASDCANVNTVDTTGYGGPNSYFTGISLDYTSGVVNFIKPLAPGASTYFSLEEALSASQITVGGTDLAVSLDNFVTKLKAGRSMTYCATATNRSDGHQSRGWCGQWEHCHLDGAEAGIGPARQLQGGRARHRNERDRPDRGSQRERGPIRSESRQQHVELRHHRHLERAYEGQVTPSDSRSHPEPAVQGLGMRLRVGRTAIPSVAGPGGAGRGVR